MKSSPLDLPYTYRSVPVCSVDMHGGGILFAQVVQWKFRFRILDSPNFTVSTSGQFEESAQQGELGTVRWDAMDLDTGLHWTQANGPPADGQFSITDRGYLHCVFPKFEFYARRCQANPDVLICCGYWWPDNRQFGFCLWPSRD